MDLRGILNDDGNLPPVTPKAGRQASVASIVSPTPPSTAASQASKPSPIPQPSPALPLKPVTPLHRQPPIWARRFDWDSLQRGETRQIHIPERAAPPRKPPQQLPPQQLPQQPSLAPPKSATGLESSLTNIEPYDEVTRHVCDFLWTNVVMREDLHGGHPEGVHPGIKLEIEGKLGTLVDKERNERLRLPIASQTVLTLPPERLAFQSFMDEHQHMILNDFLNKSVADTHKTGRPKILYQHLRETDSFHAVDESALASLPPAVRPYIFSKGHHRKPRVRITRDTQSKQVKAQIIKARIADLDIFSPSEAFDCRISVNIEMSFPEDATMFDASDEPARIKDRVSYQHQHTQIDLTQVRKADGSSDKVHELEVEIMADKLIDQGLMTQAGRPEACYEELVKCFVNNIRLLARSATLVS